MSRTADPRRTSCTTWSLLEPGDEVVMMAPNYMQTWGLARAFSGAVREWPLRERGGRWRPDVDELQSLLTPRTKLLIVCNPNNPTGAWLRRGDLDAICRRPGGTARGCSPTRSTEEPSCRGDETPSVWGRYERAVVTSGLSKAYGLPGLRIGWIAGPAAFVGGHVGSPRLHEHRARNGQRPSGRDRARARQARAHPGADARHPEREPPGALRLAVGAVRPVLVRSARGGRHRLRALPSASRLGRLDDQAARGEGRADRAGRPFRHGRVPPDRVRRPGPRAVRGAVSAGEHAVGRG